MQTKLPLDFAGSKHCYINGTMVDLLRLMNRQQDPDSLFFQRRIMLTGDTELGLQIRNVLDAIDMDESPEIIQRVMQWSRYITANAAL
jgi:predicted lipid carrier protein YhbT